MRRASRRTVALVAVVSSMVNAQNTAQQGQQAAAAAAMCEGYVSDTRKTCEGMSANISPDECEAWQDLFCSTNGFTGEGTWTNCLSTLNDPCSCKFPDQNGRLRGVTCHHNVNNGTAHIDQIDFSGGYHGMRGKLPNFVLRMHKLSLLDLKGNLIEGVLDFNAHTNLWHRRIVGDTFQGLIRAGESNWEEPTYTPFAGSWHEDDTDAVETMRTQSSSETMPYVQRASKEITKAVMIEINRGVTTPQEALESYNDKEVQGITGVRAPFTERQLHDMIKLSRNFQYICLLCPEKIPTPAPTDPFTKNEVPTPAPGKLDESDMCLGGTCSFRMFFGAPCDEPSHHCQATPPLRVGASVTENKRDMSIFDAHYAPANISITLNTSIAEHGFIQHATATANATEGEGEGSSRRRLMEVPITAEATVGY